MALTDTLVRSRGLGRLVHYLFAANYGSCRADGHGQITCFIMTLFVTSVEILTFVAMTIMKVLTSILP